MQHIFNLIRGALIGSAELVPGISGGTVALIVGIYERALASADKIIKGKFKEVDWLFILFVGVGMVAAVFGMSSVLSAFVDNNFSISHALFMGMVAVSIIVPLSMMSAEERRKPIYWLYGLISAIVIFVVTGFTADAVEDPSLIVIFFAAAVAICALIIPGVSGSFLLLAMGLYAPTLQAVSELDFVYIGVFAAGAATGLISIVQLVLRALERIPRFTVVLMAGLMAGSLRALWPWQDSSERYSTGDISAPLLFMVAGAAFVLFMMVLDARTAKANVDKQD